MRSGVWLYPWDLFDRGPSEVARDLHRMGVDDVFLALSYHSVHVLSPDNPRRRLFHAPHAALYVRPEPEAWRELGIAPSVASLVTDEGDAGQTAQAVMSELPLRLVAWTVCLHDSSLARRQPAAATVDPWGQRSALSLCLQNPWTRAYARTVVRAVSAHVEAVQLEAAHWIAPHALHAKLDSGQPHVFTRLTSLCVCDYCADRMAAAGADPPRLRAELARVADGALDEPTAGVVPEDDVDAFLEGAVHDFAILRRCRTEAVTSLVGELVGAAEGKPVEFVSYGDRRLSGADLSAVEQLGVAVRVLAYGPPERVRRLLDDVRAAPDAPGEFGVGLSVLPSDTSDESVLRSAYQVVRESGATSTAYYNYGMLTPARREWLRSIVHDSG